MNLLLDLPFAGDSIARLSNISYFLQAHLTLFPFDNANLMLQADVSFPEQAKGQPVPLLLVSFLNNHDLYVSCLTALNCISIDFHEYLIQQELFI